MSAPIKGKPFNADEVFAKTVRYYVDKKGYDVERANTIAQKVVEQQKKQRELT